MKKLFSPLLTALFVLIPFISVHAGDRESSIEVGQSRAQAKKMQDQLDKIRKESDKRAPAGAYSTQASKSMDGAPGTGD